MRRVILIFPDCTSIAEFISKENLKQTEINCVEQTVETSITLTQVKLVRKNYKAVLKAMKYKA